MLKHVTNVSDLSLKKTKRRYTEYAPWLNFSIVNISIKIGKRCFENVAQLRYFGTTITNQNLIQEEIKRRLNSGNACYHSVQNLLS
jgi:hypothetical protein